MAIKRKIVLDEKPRVSVEETPAPAPVAASAPVQQPVTQNPVEQQGSDGKFRRLKNGVAKVKRFERDLTPDDRDVIIRWWNGAQRLVEKEDPVCATLTAQINERSAVALSPMQVAGYMSHLCRLGLLTEETRQMRISRALARGAFRVAPVYSRGLLDAIQRNWEEQRADEILRAQAHAQLRAARQEGRRLRIKSGAGGESVIAPAHNPHQVVQTAPLTEEEEPFDIKWM